MKSPYRNNNTTTCGVHWLWKELFWAGRQILLHGSWKDGRHSVQGSYLRLPCFFRAAVRIDVRYVGFSPAALGPMRVGLCRGRHGMVKSSRCIRRHDIWEACDGSRLLMLSCNTDSLFFLLEPLLEDSEWYLAITLCA